MEVFRLFGGIIPFDPLTSLAIARQTRNQGKFLLAGKVWPFLGEIAQFESTGYAIYFPIGAGAGAAASLCWAQAPSPKAVAKTAMTMIIFRNFNLSTSFRRGLLRFV